MSARSEATIFVVEDGVEREVTVLFTNRALAEAEVQLKRSIIGIAQGFNDGSTGVLEMVHLLRAGMEAHRRDARTSGRQVSLNDAYDVLEEAGFPAVAEAVMGAVAAVLGYNPESSAEDGRDPN